MYIYNTLISPGHYADRMARHLAAAVIIKQTKYINAIFIRKFIIMYNNIREKITPFFYFIFNF